MKTFAKRAAITCGVLMTALICMGIVYIDTIQNYWYVNGGFVKLIVSNQTAQAVMTVSTNNQAVGFFTNETTRSFQVVGRRIPTNFTGNGTSGAAFGVIQLVASEGGHSGATNAGTVTGGAAGTVTIRGGVGGTAEFATTNATGGSGGSVSVFGGAGSPGQSAAGMATNMILGGGGANITLISGAGGIPAAPATNTLGGNGGGITASSGAGGTPSAGWARQGGQGGNFSFNAGGGGGGTRTNAGAGGAFTLTSGSGGTVGTGPGDGGNGGQISHFSGDAGSATGGGNPGIAGDAVMTAGTGATGATNSNGGRIHLVPGLPGSGAVAGDVVVGRDNAGGISRGGLMVGPLLGGAASITNVLGGSAALDFGSVAAGTVEDLPITVTGVVSNNCAVALSVAWQSASGNGGVFSTYNSNDVVYVRFANNNLVAAIDPPPFTATVVVFRIR